MKIPLSKLLVGENPPAGMNPFTFMTWAGFFRRTAEPCKPPILVTPEGDLFRIHDGRHRYVGALVAGRTEIDAEIWGGEDDESGLNSPPEISR